MMYPVSKALTLLIIIFHSPPTTSHPTYHLEGGQQAIGRKKENCCFNFTLIFNIFLKALVTISTTPVFERLNQPMLG